MNEFFVLVLREQGEFTNEALGDAVQERRRGKNDSYQGEKK